MNIRKIFNGLFNAKLTEEMIIKIYYTACNIISGVNIHNDELFIDRVNELDDELIKLIAAMNIYDIVQQLPLMVANPAQLKKIIDEKGLDHRAVILLILSVRLVFDGKWSNITKSKAYSSYCSLLHDRNINNQLNKDEYINAAENVLFITIGTDLIERLNISKHDYEVFIDLCEDVCIPSHKRAEFFIDCLDGVALDDLIDDHLEGIFTNLDNEEIEHKLSAAKATILKMTPLKCAQILSIIKTNSYYATSPKSGETIKQNTTRTAKNTRFPIEQAFVSFGMRECVSIDNAGDLVLVGTTPFLVEDVIETSRTTGNIYIVSSTSNESDLFIAHYGSDQFVGKNVDNLDFFTLDEIKEFDEIELNEATVVISENSVGDCRLNQIAEYFERRKAKNIIVLATDKLAKDVATNNTYKKDIFLLPTVKEIDGPKYQSLLIYDLTLKNEIVNIHRVKTIATIEAKQMVTLMTPKQVSVEELMAMESLRNHIPKSRKKRSKAKEYKLSEEITVFVNGHDSGEKGEAYIKYKNNKLKDSVYNYRGETEAGKILNKYLEHVKNINGKKVEIRELIKQIIKDEHIGTGISLKSVWLMEKNACGFFSARQAELIDEMLRGNLGKMNADYYSFEDIYEEIKRTIQTERQAEACKLISMLARISAQNGYTRNDYDDYEHINQTIKRGTRIIRENMIRTSLKISEAQVLYNEILKVEDISMRIALQLRMLGMEPNVIAALSKGDVTYECGDDLIQLRVSKVYNSSEGRVKPINNRYQKRIIPLSGNLANEIQLLSESENKNEPLFKINDARITPQKIAQRSQEILKKLGHEKIYIDILTTTERTTRKIDVSVLAKDVFRGTFSYLARKHIKMSESDVKYILGLKPVTTAAVHYIEFKSELVQKRIVRELSKVEAILKGENNE